jgi:hypothetical protein
MPMYVTVCLIKEGVEFDIMTVSLFLKVVIGQQVQLL